jgi:hypothetical protein
MPFELCRIQAAAAAHLIALVVQPQHTHSMGCVVVHVEVADVPAVQRVQAVLQQEGHTGKVWGGITGENATRPAKFTSYHKAVLALLIGGRHLTSQCE